MSGPISGEAETLKQLGIDTRVLSSTLGDASTIKMSYAGITKGFQALGASMALGAGRNGAQESLVAELKDSQPQLYGWLSKCCPPCTTRPIVGTARCARSRSFCLPEKGASTMLAGAADLYEHIAEDNRAGPQSEIISSLDRFIGR